MTTRLSMPVAGDTRASSRVRVAEAALLLYVTTLPWAIAPMSVALASCAAAALLAWTARPARERAPVVAASLAWFAAHLVSATFALDPAASFHRVAKGLMPLIVVLAGDLARPPRTLRRATGVLLVSAAASAIFGIISWALHHGPDGRARGAVGHYMTFGGQLMLLGALALGLVVAAPGRWRAGAAACLGVVTAALVLTFTRSAWIGTAIAVTVIAAVRRPRWVPWVAVGVALVVAVAPPRYRDRALSAFDLHHVTNVQRTYMWRAGLRMLRDHPLTGVGLEDLKPVYDRYREPGATERAGHLHSVPIQIAATMGLVGVVAFAWLVVALARVPLAGGWRALRAPGVEAGLRLGALAGLAGFLVAGLFEWNMGDEELLHLLFVTLGLAWAARPRATLPGPVPARAVEAPVPAGAAPS